MSGLEILSAVIGIAGTAVSAVGTIAAGKAEQDAANYEAAQLEIKANEEMAAGQKEAMQLNRRKKLALSALQNRAAASGFTATDKTAMDLTGEIASYGTFQEQLAQYGGKSRQQGLRDSAKGRRLSGRAAAKGAKIGALGTIVGGISTYSNPARYG